MTANKKTRIINQSGELFLFRNSYLFFISFFIMTQWAFWSSYYNNLSGIHSLIIHFHGIAMTLWCLMLISQALLIRFRKFRLHRISGKLSYALVPGIIISGFSVAHHTTKDIDPVYDYYYYLVALMYNAIIAFALIYGLAIIYRKKPGLHARFMISTVFPLFTPVTDRIIYKNFDYLVDMAPTLNGVPMVPLFGFLAADLILIGLVLWDWLSNGKVGTFLVALLIVLTYQLSVLTFYQFGFWKTFGVWLAGLPLS
jgi:hypothetical protein